MQVDGGVLQVLNEVQSYQSTFSAFLTANTYGFSGGAMLQRIPGTIEAAFPVLGFQNMLGHWQPPSTAGPSHQFLLQAMKISTFSHNSSV